MFKESISFIKELAIIFKEMIIEIPLFLIKFMFFCVFIIIILLIFFQSYLWIKGNPKNARPLYIILLGTPESSKETTGMVLSKKYKIPYLSLKDINKTENKTRPKDALIENFIIKRLKSNDCKNGLVLNGYPYTLTQAKNLHRFIYDNIPQRSGYRSGYIILINLINPTDIHIVNKDTNQIYERQLELKEKLILNDTQIIFYNDHSDYSEYSGRDPIIKYYIKGRFRGTIFVNSNKLILPQVDEKSLFKEINNILSGLLLK